MPARSDPPHPSPRSTHDHPGHRPLQVRSDLSRPVRRFCPPPRHAFQRPSQAGQSPCLAGQRPCLARQGSTANPVPRGPWAGGECSKDNPRAEAGLTNPRAEAGHTVSHSCHQERIHVFELPKRSLEMILESEKNIRK